MSFADLMNEIGGFREEPAKIICGGPMMGYPIYDMDVPITKLTNGFVCLTQKEAALPPEQSCIRCGKCVGHCCMNLMPLELNKYAVCRDLAQFNKYDGSSCIECGVCTYVCPAKRHLTQSIRMGKRLCGTG